MRRAACLIPGPPHYGRREFIRGIEAAGMQMDAVQSKPTSGDVLVIWNRRRCDEAFARKYEQAGATVIVVENGYLCADTKPPRYYAIAKSHHLGAGEWHAGEGDRFSALGHELKPWRKDGKHILILPQRGIGEQGIAMPNGWPDNILRRLKDVTDRPLRIRRHPGKRPHPSLDPDLENAWAVVTWASGAALKAIIAGIPVFHELPNWIGAQAAKCGIDRLERPYLGDRMPMLHRLSWAQWTAAEIKQGEPFRCLCP